MRLRTSFCTPSLGVGGDATAFLLHGGGEDSSLRYCLFFLLPTTCIIYTVLYITMQIMLSLLKYNFRAYVGLRLFKNGCFKLQTPVGFPYDVQ